MKRKSNNKSKRVVVTGMSVVTPLGLSLDEFWKNLISGKSGVRRIDRFNVEKISSKIAAQIRNFDPRDYMNGKLKGWIDFHNLLQQLLLWY